MSIIGGRKQAIGVPKLAAGRPRRQYDAEQKCKWWRWQMNIKGAGNDKLQKKRDTEVKKGMMRIKKDTEEKEGHGGERRNMEWKVERNRTKGKISG